MASSAVATQQSALLLLGEDQDAAVDLRQALCLYRKLGDRIGLARVHHYLSIACEREDHFPEALEHALRAAPVPRRGASAGAGQSAQ